MILMVMMTTIIMILVMLIMPMIKSTVNEVLTDIIRSLKICRP